MNLIHISSDASLEVMFYLMQLVFAFFIFSRFHLHPACCFTKSLPAGKLSWNLEQLLLLPNRLRALLGERADARRRSSSARDEENGLIFSIRGENKD